MKVNANQMLRHVKHFLAEGNESITSYLAIDIEIRGIRENLFKLRKKKIELRLNINDHGFFELNVYI